MILQLFSGPEGAGRVSDVTVEAYLLVRRRRRLLGLDYVVVLRFALLALLCFLCKIFESPDGLLSMLRVSWNFGPLPFH